MKHLVSVLEIFVFTVVTTAILTANATQGHFRWRNDDGNETSAAWRQPQSTNDTLKSKSRIRIRMELYQSGTSATIDGSLALWYSTDNTNWNQITNDSLLNDWILSRSPNFTDSSATTQQLTISGFHFSSPGLMVDSTVPVVYELPANASSEFEFSIAPTSHAVSGTLYYFRMFDQPTAINAWDSTPTLLYLNGVTAMTGSATSIGPTTATISGSAFPDNGSATVRILYGTSPVSYSDSVFASPSSVSGNSATSVSQTLTGLARSATYYYTVAASGANYSRGVQLQFTTTNDIAGYALKFNGSPDSECVEAPFLTTNTFNITLEGWVKWNGATTHNQFLFYNGNSGSTGYGLYLDHSNSDKVSVLAGGNFIANSQFILPVGVWTHVAVTCDFNATWIVYVNGVRDSVHTGTSNGVSNSDGFFIGGHVGTPSETFYGTIDEVRFWNSALDSSTIRRNMHLVLPTTTPGLANCYQITDTTGVTATDVVAQNNGTLINFRFDATDGWVTSTAPIGGGIGADSGGFLGGTATLGTLSASMTDAFDNPVDFVATGITVPPDSLPTGSAVLLNSQYWVLTPYGTPGAFSTNLTFTVPPSFTANGTENPNTYTLYHRGDESDGSWTPLLTSASGVTSTTITFDGVTSFSQFMIGSSDNALPVELRTLNAIATINGVTLQWTTSTETDNAGWAVQRRALGNQQATNSSLASNSAWADLGFVKGSGTSTGPKQYSFKDQKVLPGQYAYRLKQVDRNGTSLYSKEAQIDVGSAPKVFSLNQNYPNPFNPTTTIEFTLPADGHVVLKVYDIVGREVATLLDEDRKAGVFQQVIFDASRLSSGVFFAVLRSEGKELVSKMLLMK